MFGHVGTGWVLSLALGLPVLTVLSVLLGVALSRRSRAGGAGSRGDEPTTQLHAAATRTMTVAHTEASQVVNAARAEAAEMTAKARRDADRLVADAVRDGRRQGQREYEERQADVDRQARRLTEDEERVAAEEHRLAEREDRLAGEEHRLAEREERLDSEQRRLDGDRRHFVGREQELAAAEAHLQERRVEIELLAEKQRAELERVAGLTADQAKAELIRTIEGQAKREAVLLVRDIESAARETADQRARHVVVDAIQRVASEQTAESVVSVLHLPGDEMKGRIIGREGRNIRTYEQITGVNLIIDDTPEAVLLSCFDPVRREIGRLTLEKLVLDGRIHPHRIEEMYERSKGEVEQLCLRAAEDALVEVGLTDVHPELVVFLGRLRYRTSYGQNVLKHLLETAHIAGLMAAELGVDPQLVKRGAFLHDIGKALTHEVEGSHALVGAELARRYGEPEEVVHAIEAHHNEVTPQTIEAVLTQAADACSGGRPGARRESLENYIKRLERIEEIAAARPGVDRVFAMQAGREVRVMVAPDQIDDIAAQVLARDIAKQIEEELTYPGQIRVTVLRETRATEIAR